MDKERKYCGNCTHQPEPLRMCEYGESQTNVFINCPYWEEKTKEGAEQ